MRTDKRRCVWQVEYGTVNVSVKCGKKAHKAGFCREHEKDWQSLYPHKPLPGRPS